MGLLLLSLWISLGRKPVLTTVQSLQGLEALLAWPWKPLVLAPYRLTSHRQQPTGSPGAGGRPGTTPPASRPLACEASPAGPGPEPPGAREAPSTNSAAQALRDLRRRPLLCSPGAVQAGLGHGRPAFLQSLQIRDLVFHGCRDLLEPIAQLHLLGRAVLLQGSDDLKRRDQLDRGRLKLIDLYSLRPYLRPHVAMLQQLRVGARETLWAASLTSSGPGWREGGKMTEESLRGFKDS